MSFAKGGKKTRKTRKPWYKKKYSVEKIAKTAWNTAKYLKGIINSELKYNDTTATNLPISSAGSIQQLTDISQGTDNNQRNGNSLLMKSVFIRGKVELADSDVSCQLRMIIFRDTMNQGSIPLVGDVLNNVGSTISVFSPLNENRPGRFKIVYSKLFTLNKNGMDSHIFKTFIKTDKHIKYTGPLGSDEFKNQYYILLISSEATTFPSVSYFNRVRYYDN